MASKVILLMNLGSPDSTSIKDLKKYLSEFLMDEQVVDVPKLLRTILVKGIIVPFRSKGSSEKYKSVWTEEGSPLIVMTNQLAEKVEAYSKLPTYVCMRYGKGAPKEVLAQIVKDNPELEEVVFLPLYPHYAMSSYGTAVSHVKEAYKELKLSFILKVVSPFYDNAQYITNVAATLKPFLEKKHDHVLFSYHGIPVRHVEKTDTTRSHCFKCENCCEIENDAHKTCYNHQVKVTTDLVAKELGLSKDKYSVSFQSRLGTDKWLTPSTTDILKTMPKKGIKDLIVLSPAFVTDCLETLQELHLEEKENFIESGGNDFQVVPCLNANDGWVKTVDSLITNA